MKIGFIYPLYFPSVGGVEMYMKSLAEELEKEGHEIHVFTSDPHYKGKNSSLIHWIDTKKIGGYDTPQKDSAIRELTKNPVEILHYNGPHPYTTAFAWYAKKLQYPSVLTYHAHVHPASIVARIIAFTERLFYRWLFTRMIVTTSYYKKETAKFYPSKRIDIVPLGVNELLLSSSKNENLQRHPQKGTVLFVGALDQNHRYKGVDILLDTAKNTPALEYILVGDGDRKKYFEEEAKKKNLQNISFKGRAETAHELLEYYKSADVLVLPSTSNSEGYGMVLLEAMACGIPIITTDKVGSHEEISSAHAGMIVPAGNSQKLADAIQEVLNDSELREKLIRNGRTFVQERSWKQVATETLKCYEKLQRKNKGQPHR